jgi:hypothetical protein
MGRLVEAADALAAGAAALSPPHADSAAAHAAEIARRARVWRVMGRLRSTNSIGLVNDVGNRLALRA